MVLARWARLAGLQPAQADEFDFGWSRGWTLWPLAMGMALLAAAAYVAAKGWALPTLVLAFQSASFFAGHLIALGFADGREAYLPLVALLSARSGSILDAGCGAGRTSLALARAYPDAHIVALDRFDAAYITSGGERLLRRNIALAGVTSRVEPKTGDLLHLPFDDNALDAAVSAHAMDHLGAGTARALSEIHRVLKPGGRFLLVVWAPSWAMFAISSVLCFALAPVSKWRRWVGDAGFRACDEGWFNGMWFVLLEKPQS